MIRDRGNGASVGPTVVERFAAQVRRRPDAPALTWGDTHLTYAEVDREAGRIADHLRNRSVGRGDLVGVCLPRSPEAIAAIIAVMKAGAAYLPLDPSYPADRLSYMIKDAVPRVVLVDDETIASVPDELGDRCLDVRMPLPRGRHQNGPHVHGCAASVAPRDLAYVIYTSGSTGTPKGVMVSHANLGSLFTATEGELAMDETDVWLCVHSLSFDFSVWEMWGALAYGGRLVLAGRTEMVDPTALVDLVARERVTILNHTPAAHYRIADAVRAGLEDGTLRIRLIVFGGEALSWSRVAAGAPRRGRVIAYVNMYGITEGTVHVTWRRVMSSAIDEVPDNAIGHPLPSAACYVLDDDGSPAGTGVAGELYVGGCGVAQGYLNRPEETAHRFLPDPFSADPSAVMYRSGDRVMWTEADELIYLGRLDRQVKVRGHRVECAEVEHALRRHPAVTDCAVVLREGSLVAYVTGCSRRERDDVIARARRWLPEHAVPSRVHLVDALPLTAHGKVDHDRLLRLPPPDEPAQDEPTEWDHVPPRTALEVYVLDRWHEVLGHTDMDVLSPFGDVGGHSFAAVALQQRLRADGHQVSVVDLYRHGTVRSLAAFLAGQGGDPRVTQGRSEYVHQRRQAVRRLARAREAGEAPRG
jgi:amino acid adenylation domain-containing protein